METVCTTVAWIGIRVNFTLIVKETGTTPKSMLHATPAMSLNSISTGLKVITRTKTSVPMDRSLTPRFDCSKTWTATTLRPPHLSVAVSESMMMPRLITLRTMKQ